MELNLQRPILFFDIESTGLNIASDAIIELSFVKVLPGSEERIKTWRVKPWDYAGNCQKKITPSAQAIHGISDDDLKDCPRFSDIADEVVAWLEDSDLAGFNSTKFDTVTLRASTPPNSTFRCWLKSLNGSDATWARTFPSISTRRRW